MVEASMALKQKGTAKRKATRPKAGPKSKRDLWFCFVQSSYEAVACDHPGCHRRRHNKELSDEAKKNLAVAAHRPRKQTKAVRKSGKVKTYQYKEAEPAKAEPPQEWQPAMREPQPGEFLVFLDSLSDEQKPHALNLFRMACTHVNLDAIVTIAPLDPSKRESWMQCERCGIVMKWAAKTIMLRQEWMTYCPEGFDMHDWDDLFTKDKSLWTFISDEAEHELVSSALGEEVAA
jgi:hypothetical protein